MKKLNLVITLGILGIGSIPFPVYAQNDTENDMASDVDKGTETFLANADLLQFDVGFIDAFRVHPNYNSWSGVVRWVPEYTLDKDFKVGVDGGVSSFKSTDTTRFMVWEYGATGRYLYNEQWSGRLFVGGQSWSGDNGGSSFALGVTGLYTFPQTILSFLPSVFVTYMPLFKKPSTHEISAGVELKF